MTRLRVAILLSTVLVVIFFGYLASLYARGYRFSSKTFRFSPSGLLVIKSVPDGAQVNLNGDLKGASNLNLNLAPGTYDLTIKKEGYHPWSKRIVIQKEIVTELEVSLFKLAPSLSAISLTGAFNPAISPNGTKIIYGVPASRENISQNKDGLWLIETVNLPLGFLKDPKRLTEGDLSSATWQFSPDGREILLTTVSGNYLLETTAFTPQNKWVNVTPTLETIKTAWVKQASDLLASHARSLPETVLALLTDGVTQYAFSPDEEKILYQTAGSFTLPANLIPPFPGASTQSEERVLQANRTYVYDVQEDRNFLLSTEIKTMFWFPTSKHLLVPQTDKIVLVDYDGTNPQTIYSGSYLAPFAFPVASPDRIVLLTNLGATEAVANLYSLSIK